MLSSDRGVKPGSCRGPEFRAEIRKVKVKGVGQKRLKGVNKIAQFIQSHDIKGYRI